MAPGRRSVAALAIGLVAVGGVDLLAVWWRDPTTRMIYSNADILVQVGRATGLLAGYLVLIEVLLMARLPVLERRIGTDWLAAAHRWLGTYLVFLIATHVSTTLVGYAQNERTSVVHETASVVLTYPDVMMATVAAALFALVLLASVRPVRRRLSYETWHGIHLYVYLAIALAFAHQLANGAQFVTHPLARALWVAMNVTAGCLLVGFRVVAPLLLAARHRFSVAKILQEEDGSTSVYVTGRRLGELAAEPGQHFRWRFLTRHGWSQAHPFSLSETPNGRWLRMTAKPVGDHTHYLTELRIGTRVLLEGPYGAVTGRLARAGSVLFIAGGSGIAPILALLQEAAAGGRRATLIYRVHDAEQLPFRTDLERLAGTPGVNVHVLAGPRAHGARDPLHPARLRALVPDIRDRDVYLCGPEGMVRHVAQGLSRLAVPTTRVHTEAFAL
ncbi:MAG: ferredoxin reductase family protein [Mycobacteriales bacterium]